MQQPIEIKLRAAYKAALVRLGWFHDQINECGDEAWVPVLADINALADEGNEPAWFMLFGKAAMEKDAKEGGFLCEGCGEWVHTRDAHDHKPLP